MADKDKSNAKLAIPAKKKGGGLKNIFMLAILALVVLGGLSYFTFEPQKLSDIDGYEETIMRPAAASRDLLAGLEHAINALGTFHTALLSGHALSR